MCDWSILEQVFDSAPVVISAGAIIVGNKSWAKLAVPGVPGPCEVTDLVAMVRVLTFSEEPF